MVLSDRHQKYLKDLLHHLKEVFRWKKREDSMRENNLGTGLLMTNFQHNLVVTETRTDLILMNPKGNGRKCAYIKIL